MTSTDVLAAQSGEYVWLVADHAAAHLAVGEAISRGWARRQNRRLHVCRGDALIRIIPASGTIPMDIAGLRLSGWCGYAGADVMEEVERRCVLGRDGGGGR